MAEQKYRRVAASPLAQLCQSMRKILVVAVKAETLRLQKAAQIQQQHLSIPVPKEGEPTAREKKAAMIQAEHKRRLKALEADGKS